MSSLASAPTSDFAAAEEKYWAADDIGPENERKYSLLPNESQDVPSTILRATLTQTFFSQSDMEDYILMALGTLGDMVTGVSNPIFHFLFGRIIDTLNKDPSQFMEEINELCLALVVVGAACLISCTLQVLVPLAAILTIPLQPTVYMASALDSYSESMIQESIDALTNRPERKTKPSSFRSLARTTSQFVRQTRPTVIVAHRLSTVLNADRIVVVDQGELKEIGSHSQLMDIQDGLYRSLYNKHKQASD